MGALVFVTTELSPFTPGGIGRVLHNMLKSMTVEDRRRTYVLMLDGKIGKPEFAAVFPGVRLISVDSATEAGRFEANGHHPPRRAYSNSDLHWKSSVVFRALRNLARTVEIAYVEFPDWGALGFTTIQEKKVRGFLSDALLAVRLHSAHAMLMHHEAHAVSAEDRNIVDLERKALRDCDVIVAQLAPVAERTREVLGFSEDEWTPRLVVHAPPVLLDTTTPHAETHPASTTMPIMFGSKLQRFKRPDLFIRGVSAFFNKHGEYQGDALISAHSFDAVYRKSVLGLVPPTLAERFHFDAPKESAVREPLIAGSTFVVPSDFESFCLAAYEASLLGARVILNGKNPAFGDDTPWTDGVNCHKFDGSALGLLDALERSFEGRDELRPVVVPSDPWPWTTKLQQSAPSLIDDFPLVSVVIPHFNLGRHLPSTLVSVLEQTYPNIEIILVDDCSTDEDSQALIDDLRSKARAGMKVIAGPANLGLGAARNLALAEAAGKYIIPLDADDLLDRRFVEVAVRALQRNPDFDIVVSPAGYFIDGEPVVLPGEKADCVDYAIFVGEALVSGFQENRFSTATAAFRADVLRAYRYNDSLRSYEDWNLYLRLAQDGRRFLVTTDVYFFYRNRPNSMVKEAHDWNKHALFIHDNLRAAVNIGRLTPLAYLAFCPPARHEPASAPIEDARPAPIEHAPPAIIQYPPVYFDAINMLAASMSKQLWRERKRRKSWLNAFVSRRRRSGDSNADVRATLESSDLFDREWYLDTYLDVRSAGIDPVVHYIRHGAGEGRDPGPFFSTRGYLTANPDVEAAGMNALFHYLRHGFREQRRLRL